MTFYVVSIPAGKVVQIVPFRPRRLSLMIMNDSDYDVYVAPFRDKIADYGMRLMPYTSLILLESDGDKPELEYFGYSTADVKVRVIEGLP